MLSLSGLSVSACSSVLRRAARDTLPESPHLEAICFYEMFTIPAPDSYCYWSHYWWSTGRRGFQGTGMWRCLCMKGQRQKTNAFPALALLCIFWNTGFLITSHNMRVLKRSSQRQYFVSPIKITIHFFFYFCGEFSNYNTFTVARNNPKLIIALQIVRDMCILRNYLVRG